MADSYPFPDNIHVSSSVTIKLTDSNYLLWKTQFESLLFCQKLIGFVNGAVTAPAKTSTALAGENTVEVPNPRYEAWFCTDQLVRSWLFGTLSLEILGYVHNIQTSREIWIALAENFNKSSVAREFALRRSLQLLTKKDKTFATYCREFISICDALSSIGKPVDESMKVFGFLNGLGREFDPITTVIQSSLSKLSPPTFNDVISEVESFDSKLRSYEETDAVSQHLAFQVQQSDYGGNNSGGYKGRGRGGNNQNRGRSGYSSRGRGFNQHQSNGSNSGERPICQICGRVGHSAVKCYNRFDNNYQGGDMSQAFASMKVSDENGKEWVTDSAATAHVTSSTDNLNSLSCYEGNDTVMVGDGAFLPITHLGSATISSPSGTIRLNDVLVCPKIQKSLLSVSKLCDDYPCGVYFDANKVCVIDINTQKVVARGPRNNGLYVLKDCGFAAFYSNRHCATSEDIWHHRLGHCNSQILQQLKTTKEIDVNKSRTSTICEPCQMGKNSRLQFLSSTSRVLKPLDRVHCDLWGPSPVVSNQGYKFYAVFVDDFTRFSWFYPLKAKSEFFSTFSVFQKQVENQFDAKIKEFQSDGGGEFTSHALKKHFTDNGILHRVSCPYTPQQNGVAERKHRHLVELGLSMMFHSHSPLKYWVEAFYAANFIINLLPSQVLNNKSPYETLLNTKPNYSMLRVFGSACYPCLRPMATHKFEPRSLLCVFLGYHSQYKGYRCLHPPTGKVYISRHVVFDEEILPFRKQYSALVPRYQTPLLKAWQSDHDIVVSQEEIQSTVSVDPPCPRVPQTVNTTESNPAELDSTSDNNDAGVNESSDNSVHSPTNSSSTALDSESENANNASDQDSPAQDDLNINDTEHNATVEDEVEPAVQQDNAHSMTTRAKAGVHKPNPRYALVTSLFATEEPKTLAAALKHPGWNQAVSCEMETIHMLHTWTLVPPTEDMNILNSRWVFKTKLKPDGTVDKLKARLVAKGFEQEEGLDYLETFSPVVRTATIRMVLDVATKKKWPIKQLDVSNAFLHGELKEPVFMSQPPGFIDPTRPSHVCRLTKALYGLKQAPRAWFNTFSNFLIEFGFTCSKADPSLFTYHKDGKSLVLLLYVDDILLTGSHQPLLTELLQALHKRFAMKDLGPPRYFLGIEIEFYSGGLFLHQQAYAKDILHQAAMSNCNPMPTPLPLQLDNLNSEPFTEPTYFRSLAGKLQYLTITRPDIQFAVNFICQRMHSPTISDFGLLKRILRYIKGTITMGFHIRKDSNLLLSGYCDSDWAGCKETRRSTTGFCTILGKNLISWSAKRQQTVSNSSTEAEYRALTALAKEVTWLSFLLRDLGILQSQPTLLQCDNLSAVYLSTNPALHSRSKHFDTDYHYIREQVALGLIETRHIPATLQLADIFTKSLPRRPFIDLRGKLGVADSPTPSLRGNVSDKEKLGLKQAHVTKEVQEKKDPTKKSPTPSSLPQQDKTKAVSVPAKRDVKPAKETRLYNRFDTLQTLYTN